MPTNKARTSDNAQKQSASNAIPIFYSDLLFCSLSNKSSSSWSRPCTHHVSSSPPAYIDLILFPYCFRIVSASGSENDRRTIGERYGINTGLIRERYENDTRTVFSDSHPKLLIRNLIFLVYRVFGIEIGPTCRPIIGSVAEGTYEGSRLVKPVVGLEFGK